MNIENQFPINTFKGETKNQLIEFIKKVENKSKEELNAEIEKYQEALIWCSGSEDFQLEGQARKGWEEICVPLLNKIK